MKIRSLSVVLIAVIVMAMASGCGTVNKKTYTEKLTKDALQQHAENVLTEEEMTYFKVPYAINDELALLAKSVQDLRLTKTELAKKVALLLLEEETGLGITYSRNCNLTALEVYGQREANCISYTNLFIGMARAIGIDANYAEVTEVESFDKVGGTVVYNSHICAVVFQGPKPYLVDFSLRSYPQYHSWRVIDDREAAASFYNNIGSYHILSATTLDDFAKARIYYQIAAKLYPNLPQVYNNMGVLLLRENKLEEAELMYRKALEIKPGYFAPYSNLSNIFISRGEVDRAIGLMREAVSASPENHFAYLTLARLYIKIDDFEAAESALKKALGINKRFIEARHELGRLYLRMGRGEDAMKQFALALKYQPDDDLARNKMDLIERLSVTKEQPQYP